jgi:hypothetical protein
MAVEFTASHVSDSLALFRYYKNLGERAMAQVTDDQLLYSQDDECNSIATIAKHMVGNMRSRWTDFLTTDGEKPDRNRDSEFEEPPPSREDLLRIWEDGWAIVFQTVGSLKDSQLAERVLIRGEAHSVMQAINRQLCHYAYHVGQIVVLAKQRRNADWISLSMPRRRSA